MKVQIGRHAPLGVTFDGRGTNFALFSENAERVELCLFDERGGETRYALPSYTEHVWHGYLEGVKPGQRYGYRVFGNYAATSGQRFNAAKLLVDPYARLLDGKVQNHKAVYGFDPRSASLADLRDSAPYVPKGVVCDDAFDWEGDRAPRTSWEDTVLYELHIKGMTSAHPLVPESVRGTYVGLAHDAVIAHLQSIGVTAVELLPVFDCADEGFLRDKGLVNYWGYNPISFFAPEQRLATHPTKARDEFREMVKLLHKAGIEVILDVVYNHTGEGSEHGPTISLRGIDNQVYYRVKPSQRDHYEDFTGCGNSLNVSHPQTLKLICDSLRYWVTEMHVDGFRFDLAAALGRHGHHFDRHASFLNILHQDPILSSVKLIAEPWDLGPEGYQVGNFPIVWKEWNGRYRDVIRRFWRGDRSVISEMGYRVTGSSDLFGDDGRGPSASINFITAHDGFTLRDLVSYERKHNEANLEDNRDGTDENYSQNFGVEGETDDVLITALRLAQVKNFFVSLWFSQGVPMLSMGDELFRTQHGNNNAYAQDNELSYVDWGTTESRKSILEFVRACAALRKREAGFRRGSFLRGARLGLGIDSAWFRADGKPMAPGDWTAPTAAMLALFVGNGAKSADKHGHLLVFNAEARDMRFVLPDVADSYTVELDSSGSLPIAWRAGDALVVPAMTALVMRGDRLAKG